MARKPSEITLNQVVKTEEKKNALKGIRIVFLMGDKNYSDVPVYNRYDLKPNEIFEDPAVIEELESML